MITSDLATNADVEIPDEWPVHTAASFNPFITSGSRGWAKYYAEHGDLFMRITNLKRNKIAPDLSDRQHVALPSSEREGLRTALQNGDILISITADIGIIGFIDENVPSPSYINQHVACLRLPTEKVSPKFVAYYLASAGPQRRFIEMTDVGAKTGINLTTVANLTFPCPPLKEQQAIAEALSDADGLIEGLERLIAKKRLIKQGAMQDLLTAKRRLPGFSGEWVENKLGGLCKVSRGASPRPIASTRWFDNSSTIGWVRISDLPVSGRFLTGTTQRLSADGVSRSRRVPVGSLIMSIAATVGRPAVTAVDTCIHDGFVVFYDLKIDQLFLYYLLKTMEPEWSLHGQTGSQMNINTGIIEATEVKIPPTQVEQMAIAQIFNDMDAEIQALETRLVKARQVKEGMMQNLLTGRIRLV